MAKSRREILVAIRSPQAPPSSWLEKAAVLARVQKARLHLAHIIASPHSKVAPAPHTTSALRAVKLLHTVVWAFFAILVVSIPVLAWRDEYPYASAAIGIVLVEVMVLLVNGWRCPLTGLAARYTQDRRDNFDIYLPAWLARHNKLIFGTLYILGTAFTAVRWMR